MYRPLNRMIVKESRPGERGKIWKNDGGGGGGSRRKQQSSQLLEALCSHFLCIMTHLFYFFANTYYYYDGSERKKIVCTSDVEESVPRIYGSKIILVLRHTIILWERLRRKPSFFPCLVFDLFPLQNFFICSYRAHVFQTNNIENSKKVKTNALLHTIIAIFVANIFWREGENRDFQHSHINYLVTFTFVIFFFMTLVSVSYTRTHSKNQKLLLVSLFNEGGVATVSWH